MLNMFQQIITGKCDMNTTIEILHRRSTVEAQISDAIVMNSPIM